MMQKKLLVFLCLQMVLWGVAACGVKGDLTLEEPKQRKEESK